MIDEEIHDELGEEYRARMTKRQEEEIKHKKNRAASL
jgi:hypothetical protein